MIDEECAYCDKGSSDETTGSYLVVDEEREGEEGEREGGKMKGREGKREGGTMKRMGGKGKGGSEDEGEGGGWIGNAGWMANVSHLVPHCRNLLTSRFFQILSLLSPLSELNLDSSKKQRLDANMISLFCAEYLL